VKRSVRSRRRLPVKTVLASLAVAPAALAQQQPAQPATEPPAAPPPPAGTAQPAPPSTAPVTLGTVTVTGARPSEDFAPPPVSIPRLGGNVMDIPQSITIINKDLMQSQGATSFQQAIRNVPGITIGAAEGGTIGNNININGFSARTDLYIDGMRDRGQYYRDIFALEQIEVLMGPSSMLFGRGSTGGVINQVMKKATKDKKIELQASGTTNGLTRFTADVNQPMDEDQAARVNMMFQRGKASTRDQTNLMDFGIAPTVTLGMNGPTKVTLSALFQHNYDQVDYGIPPYNGVPLSVPRNTAYGFADDFTATDTIIVGANVEHKFDKDTTLRNQSQFAYVNTFARETSGQATGFVNNGAAFAVQPFGSQAPNNLYIRRQSRDRNIDDFTVTNQTEFNVKFDTGPIGHNLLTGLELSYDSYRNQTYNRSGLCNNRAIPTNTGNLVGCVPAGFTTGGYNTAAQTLGNLALGQARGIAPYINDTIQVLPELKAIGGVRYDVYDAQVGNTQNTTNGLSTNQIAYSQQTVFFTSVRAGLLYQPTPQQTYYFSYSTSFNPSLEQLVSTTQAASSPLPPENNESFEVGAKYDLLRNQLSLTGALFQITKNNARTQNTDGTFSPTGQIRVQGFRTGVAGSITPEWSVWGGYTYLNAKITQGVGVLTTGAVPLNTPQNSATLWTTYTFDKKWEIGGGPTYMGQRYANNTNTVSVPDFVRLDATAAYKSEKYDVRINVFNLTDAYFYDQVIASDGGRAVPGSGLTAMLTLTHRL